MTTPSHNSPVRKPETLFALSGAVPRPARLAEGVLVLIDAQREYRDGRLPLDGIEAAIAEAGRLLAAARAAGTPVIHVVHHARPGSALFDPATAGAAIIPELMPVGAEAIVVKRLPNAFAGTDLEGRLSAIAATSGRRSLLLAGFMTHNCISATARAALDRGLPVTIVAAATATRDLPGVAEGIVPAAVIQASELAALADRTARVVADTRTLCRPAPDGPS